MNSTNMKWDEAAKEKLRRGKAPGFAEKHSAESFASTEHLRSGRYEIFLPFEPPYNDKEVGPLRDAFLKEVIRGYFGGGSAVVDYASVIGALPWGQSQSQGLHSDYKDARFSVSAHSALTNVEYTMGGTRFCPCSHA